MSAAPVDLPVGAIAHVSGRGTGRVVVTTGATFRVIAGPPDDPGAQIELREIDAPDLRRFVDAVLEHLRTRTGQRPRVPFEDSFPAVAQLSGAGAVLNVYDDGRDFSVMATDGGAKAGTGAFATLDGVRDFARALDAHLAAKG